MIYVLNINLLLSISYLEELDKVSLELSAIVLNELFRVLADNYYIANVALRIAVYLEGIGISVGLIAGLAILPQPSKAFGLELVCDMLY